MANINLLPWREELREKRKKDFFTYLVMSALAGFALSLFWYLYLGTTLTDANSALSLVTTKNNTLKTQISVLDGIDEKKKEIESRISVIEGLEQKRPLSVKIFEQLAALIPTQAFLTKVERKGLIINIEGKADNPNTVSDFMRALESDPLFKNTKMDDFQSGSVGAVVSSPAAPTVVTPSVGAQAAPVAGSQTAPIASVPAPAYPEDAYGVFKATIELDESYKQDSAGVVDTATAMAKKAVDGVTDVAKDAMTTAKTAVGSEGGAK